MTDPTPEHPARMTTALTFTQPRTPHERYVFAQSLAEARQLPGQIRGSQADVLLRIEYGVAVGIPPVSALTAIHIIEGKPTASAGMISGLLRTAGRLRVGTTPDPKYPGEVIGWATYTRNDDPDYEYRVEWTIDRALAAELVVIEDGKVRGKPGRSGNRGAWDTYRPAMLKARAISEIGRDAAEDVLLGVHYTPEELGANVNAEGDVIEGEVVGSSTFHNYAAPAPAEPAAPEPDVQAERLEEVRGLILAAWQDADLDALAAVFRGPVKEYELAASLEVQTLEEVDGKPTGEVVTLEELFRRVGTAIRNNVPAPPDGPEGDESGPGEPEGPDGGSGPETPAGTPSSPGSGASPDVIEGELVDEPPAAPAGEPWPETRQAPEGGHPMDLPPDPSAVMTAQQVADALGGTILTDEEVARLEEEHAAEVAGRLRNYARELGRTGADRGKSRQKCVWVTVRVTRSTTSPRFNRARCCTKWTVWMKRWRARRSAWPQPSCRFRRRSSCVALAPEGRI